MDSPSKALYSHHFPITVGLSGRNKGKSKKGVSMRKRLSELKYPDMIRRVFLMESRSLILASQHAAMPHSGGTIHCTGKDRWRDSELPFTKASSFFSLSTLPAIVSITAVLLILISSACSYLQGHIGQGF